MVSLRFALVLVALLATDAVSYPGDFPLFDAHIHYNHDVWDSLPPNEAVQRLREAGILRALVSSSSDEGTQKLYAEAPDLIIPELRPYRKTGETGSWFRDESVIEYLQERLARYRYVAIGEFHVSGANADLPVVRHLVLLAKQHGLLLHAHSDADAVDRLFRHDPDARLVWAHAGYEPPSLVHELLRRHTHLWVDLSSRDDLTANGKLVPEWRALLVEFPDRFMVGTDTHAPHRWNAIGSSARSVRGWLADLPADIAERIAHKNGEEVLTQAFLKGG
ncbi:amidohydrolase [Nitrospira moscoviensis]|uniref:Amidohydrolase 2 n=1 Tax=Nitrospira moscoviensis TaxID=42253 RepID=A0A0K2GK54_NITMO|nr:amidohydrolase [Nitrospira moscoviensis]ALA60987.1 Amidohydrolase 2 [Nitrospira moscoviensis]